MTGQWYWQRRRASPGALLHGILLHTVCDQILIFHFHLPSYYIEVIVGSAQCIELTELSAAQTVPKVVSLLVVSVGKKIQSCKCPGSPRSPSACLEMLPPLIVSVYSVQ